MEERFDTRQREIEGILEDLKTKNEQNEERHARHEEELEELHATQKKFSMEQLRLRIDMMEQRLPHEDVVERFEVYQVSIRGKCNPYSPPTPLFQSR
jgi:formate dehydrogenase maturation protein FdhE